MWKPVPNYPNYEVSDEGEIRNATTGRILKLKPNERGYYYTNLSKNSKYKTFRIHRLVAEAFIPNPENKPQVNHKDRNKQNNHVDNLEWVTNKENMLHYYDSIGLDIANIGISVVQYDLEGNYIKEYESLTQAAKLVGGSTDNIKRVCEGIWQQSKGFKWRYKE